MSAAKRLMAKTGLKPDGTNYLCPYCLNKIPRSQIMRLVCIHLSLDPPEWMLEMFHHACADAFVADLPRTVATKADALAAMTKQRLRLPHFTDSNGVRHW